jgi:hypothetical protein
MHMDRAIFNLKISIEATSAYLLLCALLDEARPSSMAEIRSLWNGAPESLERALEELLQRRVIERTLLGTDDHRYRVRPSREWRWGGDGASA